MFQWAIWNTFWNTNSALFIPMWIWYAVRLFFNVWWGYWSRRLQPIHYFNILKRGCWNADQVVGYAGHLKTWKQTWSLCIAATPAAYTYLYPPCFRSFNSGKHSCANSMATNETHHLFMIWQIWHEPHPKWSHFLWCQRIRIYSTGNPGVLLIDQSTHGRGTGAHWLCLLAACPCDLGALFIVI